jgi:peptidoglycan/LPS O-acetylase OafA/YrhL
VTSTSVVPPPLRWAVRLLVLEAVIAGGLAIFLVYQAIAHDAASVTDAFALTGFVLLIGVALAGLSSALNRRKPRARAPAIVLQLLAVMTAVVIAGAGLIWVAVPAAALGVVTASLLLAPSTGSALTG